LKFLEINTLSQIEKEQIIGLWNREYPRNLRYEKPEQFEAYLNGLKDQNHILIVDDNENIIGWYFDFIREEERWFAAIIASEFQGKGFGTKLLNLARKRRNLLNGWVILSADYVKYNGAPYLSPLEFYKKIGFEIYNDVKLETDKISAIKIKWSSE